MSSNNNPFANNPGDLLARGLVLWLSVDDLVRSIKAYWPKPPLMEVVGQKFDAIEECFKDLRGQVARMSMPPSPPRQDIYPGPVDNRWKTPE